MDDEESSFAYWPFIEQYLPDYYSRDDVLHSDILTLFKVCLKDCFVF
jgi:hypothetical protein